MISSDMGRCDRSIAEIALKAQAIVYPYRRNFFKHQHIMNIKDKTHDQRGSGEDAGIRLNGCERSRPCPTDSLSEGYSESISSRDHLLIIRHPPLPLLHCDHTPRLPHQSISIPFSSSTCSPHPSLPLSFRKI